MSAKRRKPREIDVWVTFTRDENGKWRAWFWDEQGGTKEYSYRIRIPLPPEELDVEIIE